MTRLHYTSRPNGSRRGGRAYAGVPTDKPQALPELVPVAPDLHECSSCHGHVKLVAAVYSDREVGMVTGKTRVIGSHRFGGLPSRGIDRCAGSLQLPAR